VDVRDLGIVFKETKREEEKEFKFKTSCIIISDVFPWGLRKVLVLFCCFVLWFRD
jgi:hypothetical protein